MSNLFQSRNKSNTLYEYLNTFKIKTLFVIYEIVISCIKRNFVIEKKLFKDLIIDEKFSENFIFNVLSTETSDNNENVVFDFLILLFSTF